MHPFTKRFHQWGLYPARDISSIADNPLEYDPQENGSIIHNTSGYIIRDIVTP